MDSKMLRVVHYLNQYFGGIGGEEKAYAQPLAIDGPVGPGRALQHEFATLGKVVGTVVCGDNYFAERIDTASLEVLQLITSFQPDLVIAGPAFDAGRYGIACGAVCKIVEERLGVPAVTGMHRESPGVDLYRRDVHIVDSADSVLGMSEAISRMVRIGVKLATNQRIGNPSQEGYIPRGMTVNEMAGDTGAERVISMLLKKVAGLPLETEVPLPRYERVQPAEGILDLRRATIALVTDGGLVPKGNPDRIEARAAKSYGSYSIEGLQSLSPDAYEVNHIGYDPTYVMQDPNRLVPVDILRDLEREGIIGRLYHRFFTTSGAISVLEYVERMGRSIAHKLKEEKVSAVILTST